MTDDIDQPGCSMCDHSPDGCSFCSGASAIEILRGRGGEGVIDASQALARLTPADPEPDPE